MLPVVNLEEIHGLLLRLPQLTDLLARRDPRATVEVEKWLRALEQVLANNRMPLAGNIAALRSVLLSAQRGAMPAGLTLLGRPTARRIREAAAADAIRQASDLVANAVREDSARIAEAERLTRQVVAVGKSRGLLRVPPAGTEHHAALRALWSSLLADETVKAGAVRLEGLVGHSDALIMLDRAVTARARGDSPEVPPGGTPLP